VQKTSSQIPMKTPAIVNLPIRHALGVGDGRTLSVVRDMPRRSGEHDNDHQHWSQDGVSCHN
jgi:hypothetical protein